MSENAPVLGAQVEWAASGGDDLGTGGSREYRIAGIARAVNEQIGMCELAVARRAAGLQAALVAVSVGPDRCVVDEFAVLTQRDPYYGGFSRDEVCAVRRRRDGEVHGEFLDIARVSRHPVVGVDDRVCIAGWLVAVGALIVVGRYLVIDACNKIDVVVAGATGGSGGHCFPVVDIFARTLVAFVQFSMIAGYSTFHHVCLLSSSPHSA